MNLFAKGKRAAYNALMSEPIIAQRFPYVQPVKPGSFFWCSCGKSKGQPFCDGSHQGSGFAPKKVDIIEGKTVAWCGCKHSHNGAFCDGSHSRLG
jgi:CDGSH-type Zn-finger protein